MMLLTMLDEPNYTQSFTLDGVDYRLQFQLNTRENQYYLSIFNSDGVLLLSGVKIVKDTPLTLRFKRAGLPTGDFMALGASIKDKIGEDEFVNKMEFYYITEAELEEILGE